MNLTNNLDIFLDEYYNVLFERNDGDRIVITPGYVDTHQEELEQLVTLFTLYPDYLIDVITTIIIILIVWFNLKFIIKLAGSFFHTK